jgi:hypothetical protein
MKSHLITYRRKRLACGPHSAHSVRTVTIRGTLRLAIAAVSRPGVEQ